MDSLSTLLTRVSQSTLGLPIPDDAAIGRILAAGLRAPDHGRLRPWRFLVITGEGLERLADAGVAALLRREPQASAADQDRAREKLTRAPMVIVLAGRILPDHKIPVIEQELAIGAAGMNVMNALHALGFAGKWVTGPNVYDEAFVRALGFTDAEVIRGLVMVGTADAVAATAPSDPGSVTRFWR